MGQGYCIWEHRVSEALYHAVNKGVEIRELAENIVRLFTGLWGSCVKASRASLALRVFPDLSNEELEVLSLIDAYIDAMDDFVDLECVDKARGTHTSALYVRTILLANRLMSDNIIREFLSDIGPRNVFDSEYKFMLLISRDSVPPISS